MAVSASAPKKTIEIFRAGTFATRAGDEITFSDADLAAIAAAYDPAVHEAPLVAGHPKHDDPAQGWVTGVEFVGGRLVAEVDQVNPEFAAAVGRGEYKRISAAFYPPTSKANPKPGQFYLRHVGCLGAMPPAVSVLKPLHFTAGDDDFVDVEFAQGDAAPGALLRQLRDWLTGKLGIADADGAPPGQPVSWADDTAPSPAFSSPTDTGVTMTKPDAAALDKRQADLDAREARFKEREVAFAEQERVQLRKDNEAFLDDLVKQGRFLPAQKGNTLAFMESLVASDLVVEFAEGDGKSAKIKPLDAYKRQLSALPKVVEFGEVAAGDGTAAASVEFAAPAGTIVDPDRLRLHGMALAYQRQHPDQTYIQAVKAVTKE